MRLARWTPGVAACPSEQLKTSFFGVSRCESVVSLFRFSTTQLIYNTLDASALEPEMWTHSTPFESRSDTADFPIFSYWRRTLLRWASRGELSTKEKQKAFSLSFSFTGNWWSFFFHVSAPNITLQFKRKNAVIASIIRCSKFCNERECERVQWKHCRKVISRIRCRKTLR